MYRAPKIECDFNENLISNRVFSFRAKRVVIYEEFVLKWCASFNVGLECMVPEMFFKLFFYIGFVVGRLRYHRNNFEQMQCGLEVYERTLMGVRKICKHFFSILNGLPIVAE